MPTVQISDWGDAIFLALSNALNTFLAAVPQVIGALLLIAVGGMMQAARSFTTDTSMAGTELAFGFLLLASYFNGKIFNKFGLPKLTGYIAAGVIAGPYVLDFVTKEWLGLTFNWLSGRSDALLPGP